MWYKRKVKGKKEKIRAEWKNKNEKKIKQNNVLDFNYILLKTLSVLRITKLISYYQDQYKYLMVDEYQDTNAPQYHIVKLLASRYRNLAVV